MGVDFMIKIVNKKKLTINEFKNELIRRNISIINDKYDNVSFSFNNRLISVSQLGWKKDICTVSGVISTLFDESGKLNNDTISNYNNSIIMCMNIIDSDVAVAGYDLIQFSDGLSVDEKYLVAIFYNNFAKISIPLIEYIKHKFKISLTLEKLNSLIEKSVVSQEKIKGVTCKWFIPLTSVEREKYGPSKYGYRVKQLIEFKTHEP